MVPQDHQYLNQVDNKAQLPDLPFSHRRPTPRHSILIPLILWFSRFRLMSIYMLISQGLRELHWLPIRARVLYKLCILMHEVHSSRSPSPAYIRDIVTARCSASRSGLRSASTTDYIKQRLSTKFEERAFSYAGPHAWNQLPEDLRSVSNAATFRKHLKTHFFNSVFN